jgi:hypothetical protein
MIVRYTTVTGCLRCIDAGVQWSGRQIQNHNGCFIIQKVSRTSLCEINFRLKPIHLETGTGLDTKYGFGAIKLLV